MTDSVKEQLSACLDGELPQTELDLLLKRIERDAALRESIGRYALVSEALRVGSHRAEKPVAASRAFAANVMAAIENDPALARPVIRPLTRIAPAILRRLRPAAGIAIAAGVAAIAVVSVQRIGLAPERVAVNDTVATSTVDSATENPSYIVPTTVSSPAFVPATRLTNYVVAHSEYSSPLGRRTVLSGVLADDDAVVPEESAPESPAQER